VDTTLTTPPTGGCQTFLAHLAPGLHARGHDVVVVTEPGKDSTVADRIRAAGVPVREDIWPPTDMPQERAQRLADWVREAATDAYVVSLSADVGWLALPLLPPATRTAAIVHSDGPTFYAPLAYYSAFVDAAVGVSRETHEKIVALAGVPEDRARRVPYGVERISAGVLEQRARAARHPDGLQLAYVGRVVQSQKRVLDLPALARALTDRQVPFTLHLVGDGEDAARLATALGEAVVAEGVRWWGWLAPDQVRARLLEMDSLVLPSEVEGLPLALLEAMACGVVPVVTRIPSGHTEIVRDGENGFLVAVGDMVGFAARLEQLHRDEALLSRLRRAAWETSERYSIERMVSAYEALLGQPTSRAPRPAGPYPVMPSCRSRYPDWLRRVKWRLAGTVALARRRLSPPRRVPG
jgi:glycosyltransferase involved in cell wall biosynthesis